MSNGNARSGSLERDLLNRLKYGGLDKKNLAELIKIILGFSARGVRPVKVFPIGTPWPDGVEFHAHLDLKALESLLQLIQGQERVHTIRVFPHGIPHPEIFQTEIGLR